MLAVIALVSADVVAHNDFRVLEDSRSRSVSAIDPFVGYSDCCSCAASAATSTGQPLGQGQQEVSSGDESAS